MDQSYQLRLVFCSPLNTLQTAPKNVLIGPKLVKIWLKL